jgi:hypothetical protein
MPETSWLQSATPAFRLMIATSWLAPASWQDKQEQAIREAVGAGVDWMEYIRLIDRHRTPALSWVALKRVPGLQIPEAVKQQLQKRSDACRMQAVRNCMQLAGALKGFHSAAIPVMPVKGPILSLELYGDVGLRQSHDLDLIVNPEDLARAQACLENMGWRLDESWFPLSPRQWESVLRHEYHLGFVHSHGDCLLELHWRTRWELRNQTEARWDRSIPGVWQGCSFKAMNSIDQVLYLCSHGDGDGWFRAKWMGDLARIHADGRVDWQAVLGQASRTGQKRALLASLRLLQDTYGLPVPDFPGNPWKDLPSFLIARPIHNLKIPEPAALGALARVWEQFLLIRYERLAVPQTTWRDHLDELTYFRENFGALCLPDRLYWAYAPLRPFLWFWRRVLRRGPDI